MAMAKKFRSPTAGSMSIGKDESGPAVNLMAMTSM